MKDGVRALAAEFKEFLASREEDELTPAASSGAAVPFSAHKTAVKSDNPLPTQDHLTVQFVRDKKQIPVSENNLQISSSAVHIPAGDTPALSSPSPDLSQEQASGAAEKFSIQTPMSTQDKQHLLEQIANEIHLCKRCPLGDTRLHAVPGEGNPDAELMFVGEGPGFDEDHKGRPFIGRAGQLLDKMITVMGLQREQVYIANIAKCHPMVNPQDPEARGNDRAPNSGEIAVCRKYIERQIAAISPKYVVALGSVAAKALISDTKSLGALRGRFHLLHLDTVQLPSPVKIIATYHPAALLRNPGWKKDAWADLQMVMAEMGLKRPQA